MLPKKVHSFLDNESSVMCVQVTRKTHVPPKMFIEILATFTKDKLSSLDS